MMTQTHSLIAISLFAKPSRPVRHNIAIIVGSFIPDAAIFALFIWAKLNSIPEGKLWGEIYFSEPMLTLTAIGNSFPLYGLILAILALKTYRHHEKQPLLPSNKKNFVEYYWGAFSVSALGLLALSAITHLLGDFPVHAADAHSHFWPISGWRFHSPVSYWDNNHHGHLFSLFEAALGIVLSIIIFRRFKHIFIRALLALTISAYLAVPLYFS